MKLYFADGGQKIYRDGITYYEISKDIEADLPILGVKVNNEVVPLGNVAKDGETLEFFDVLDMDGYTIYKSGLKMIFELALKRCFPNLEIHFDHSVPRGMLGTITGEKDLNNEDISLIKHEMNKIVMADLPFKKLSVKNKDALDYFHKTKNYEKEKNIRNISDKTITLYQLGNLLNFYYTDMPYSTKVISMFDLVYLGNNRIVFLWPSERSEGKIPNYIHYSNIIDTFIDAKKWLKALKMPYVTNLNDIIGNGKIKSFIHSAEIVYDFSVAKSAQEIVKQEKKFVLIAGPSSSGKTTSCKRMSEYLEAMGYHTIRISTDDYYVNRADTPLDENGEYDLECLEAIDIKQLNDDLMRLLNHEEICLPIFDFVSGKRVETNNKVSLDSNTVILIEGLHCLNDKLLSSIDKALKYKIYLSPFIPLNIDRHNYISTIDLRLMRRIVRDNRDRGTDVAATMKSWQSVRQGEEKYIFPFIQEADSILNTALAYEVGVLKVYVEPLLHAVKIDSDYYGEAQRILNFLKQFFPIPGEYVSSSSILREFIGGKNYND